MKMKFLGISLVAMSLVSFTSMAQSTTVSSGKKAATCQRVCKGAEEKCGKDRNGSKHNPFEGLNLSSEQQTKLKALQEKRMAERKEKSEKAKASKQENVAKADKESRQAAREARMAKRQECKKQFLADVKSILSPEQYVQFLENNVQFIGKNHGKGHKHGKKFAGKGRHDGKKQKRAGRANANG